jgi:hypothetical protein
MLRILFLMLPGFMLAQQIELWSRATYMDTHIFEKVNTEFEFQFREQFQTRTSNQEQQLYSFRVWLMSKDKKNWYWQHSPLTYFYRYADFTTSKRETHEVRWASQVDKNIFFQNLFWRNGLEYRYFWGDIREFSELRYRTRLAFQTKLSENKKLILNHEMMYRWNVKSDLIQWDQNRSTVALRFLWPTIELETGYQFHYRNTNIDNINVHLIHLNLKYSK